MANLQSGRCKSDMRMNKRSADPYFEDVVTKFEQRREDLALRQRHLTEKVTTMERSIPALMAYNMWTSGQKCDDAPLCKVKEIMDKLSPFPDPTDKLVEDLKSTVKNLNRETEELHDKIINADIQLEETGMELESLELANKELDEKLNNLEHELKRSATTSLHSIHSEDLVCLSKIRQLCQEEVDLKNYIKELEEKEMLFKEQMDRILTSREFQKASGGKKMMKRIQELEFNERKMHCTLQTHKYNMHQLKKKLLQKEKELARLDISLQLPNMIKKNGNNNQGEKTGKAPSGTKQRQNEKTVKINQVGKNGTCELSDKNRKSPQTESGKKSSWLPKWILSNSTNTVRSSENLAKKDNPNSLDCSCITAFTADVDVSLKKCVCPTPAPAPIPCYEKPPCKLPMIKVPKHCDLPNSTKLSSRSPALRSKVAQCPSQSCCTSLHPKSLDVPARKACCYNSPPSPPLPCKKSTHTPKSTLCVENPFCKSPPCYETSASYPSSSDKRYSPLATSCFPTPCELDSSRESRQSSTPCKECLPLPKRNGCRCSCRAKCSRGESEVPCNCSIPATCSTDKGYQPKGLPKPPCGSQSKCWLEEDTSDEICDCCDCGCQGSDDSEPSCT